MLERDFQAKLIKKIEKILPGCIIMKNDANYRQGIPDLLILFGDKWATLEVKRNSSSPLQPNQRYYVDRMNEMSYSAIIHPENEEYILNELQQTLRSGRHACLPRSIQVPLDKL